MRLFFLGLLLSFVLMGAGCSKSAPPCGDSKTKKAVIEVAMKEAKRQLKNTTQNRESRMISEAQWEKEWLKISPTIQMSLDSIRTKDFNKNVGTYECAADLVFVIKGEKTKAPITYSSELSADDADRFIVEVRGL